MKNRPVVGQASRLSPSFNKSANSRKPILLGLLLSLAPLALLAQTYSIDWHKVAGGGGTSTGGVYSVSGTVGQQDAGGPLTNGVYSLTGGYWALPVAVQSSNAPTLHILPATTPRFATVSWTPPTPGFVLQVSPTLAPAIWSNAPSGVTNPVTISATLPARFYRLAKP